MTASEETVSKRLNRKGIYRAFADGAMLRTSSSDSGKKLLGFKHFDIQVFSKIGQQLI
jgi:hypothetical protein